MIDTLYHKWLFLTSTSTHTYSLLEDDESLGGKSVWIRTFRSDTAI
jgi:hypothetical protein